MPSTIGIIIIRFDTEWDGNIFCLTNVLKQCPTSFRRFEKWETAQKKINKRNQRIETKFRRTERTK